MGNRTIRLFGDVDNEMTTKLVKKLSALGRTKGEITFLLDSGGGDEDEGWAIYDLIKQARQPTRIIVYGQALSMAAAILQAGKKRLMTPNSSFMIHPGWRVYSNGFVHTNTAIADGDWMKTANRKYLDVLASRATPKKPRQTSAYLATRLKVEEWFQQEKTFTAVEAVDFGFADALYKGPLP